MIKNIAFYAFFKPRFELAPMREILRNQMQALNIKGTLILAPEGINCSISGTTDEIDAFLKFLFQITAIPQPDIKISYSQEVAFKRALVKIKHVIVAQPGQTDVDSSQNAAPYISPEQFHQWIREGKEMVVLDTRNSYEYEIGRFQNSKHLGTKHFADFETDLQKAPQEWQNMPIVTFCTGGIRCEKAAPLMIKKGFRKVYQVEGGILNYLEKIGRGYFEGKCFVFDERVAV